MTVVAFDFDGTLSDSEMTVLLGDRCGVAGDMAEITERAMNDEIGYAESLRKRAALLEGLPKADVTAAFDEVELRPGAADLIEELTDAGVTTAILTGGFERGVAAALEAEDVSVDHIVSNRLPMADDGEGAASDDGEQAGALTGDVDGPLIEGTKDDALEDLAADVGVDLAETVAVGDGANDLPMLEVAGLAIGFEPKPAVEPHCDVVVSTMAEAREVLADENVLTAN
ncbi:phosphoserine phosphatase SerB [Natronorubrum daqingense]|uniref:phosphoserine phosphatase n=1 Tax=Natronorubrum daqingense TaxID=588898 RepID=A0A1N7EVU3_9EURY|nr:phosphoserine phosphatase SerB [Natronorubrum daqingense]APX97682.1 phosphoserine phosphatase SerB [Natronorubrum daqingense]SIR92210.1 phosphoserine phosphatase [Natronorubrum daqingense]